LLLLLLLLLLVQVPKVTVIIGGSFGAGNYGKLGPEGLQAAQLTADILCHMAHNYVAACRLSKGCKPLSCAV
jgi:hypothetical protein